MLRCNPIAAIIVRIAGTPKATGHEQQPLGATTIGRATGGYGPQAIAIGYVRGSKALMEVYCQSVLPLSE